MPHTASDSDRRKVLVLDTSAIMALVQDITTFRDASSPGFAGVLGDNEIVIPRVVLDELSSLRKGGAERAKNALEAARQLEQYSLRGSLLEGVETEKGGFVRVAQRPSVEKMRASGLDPAIPDHEIIATAIDTEDERRTRGGFSEEDLQVSLVSQDRVLRVLARSIFSVHSEQLRSICADINQAEAFRTLSLSPTELDGFIEKGEMESPEGSYSNQLYHIVDKEDPKNHYAYGVHKGNGDGHIELIDRTKVDYLKVAGEITGRNVRQKLFLWALMGCGESDPFADNGVRLITVSGPAGSGKSFLTLAAAWERLERGHFERIVVTRPMVDVGTSMGYLPGSLEEKVAPWGGPIEDNLRAIVQVPSPDEGRNPSKRGVQRTHKPFDAKTWLEMENRLELVPLTYIRGRTFRKTFVILEEAQNLERGPLKVLLTRLGEGSVVVIVGDQSQIDNQFLGAKNNGLVHAINAFRSWPQAVHVELDQIVRSDLAEAANERL